jgi:hypothetical protein
MLLIVLIPVIVIAIVLQIMLSKIPHLFFGLIIPILHLLIGLSIVLTMPVSTDSIIFPSFILYILTMILLPELIYFAIYFISRRQIRSRKKKMEEIQKMSVQDL